MDAIDRKIIYELDKNSRAPYSLIAKATRIKQETVRYRVNQLVKTGIIKSFIAIINTKKLGFSYYKLFLKLQNVNEMRKNHLLEFLKKSPQISWLAEIEGPFDISCIVSIKNQVELELFIKKVYEEFGNFTMKKAIAVNLWAEFFDRDYFIAAERKIGPSPVYTAMQEFRELDETDTLICSALAENARLSALELAKMADLSADSVIFRIKKLQKEQIIKGYTILLNNERIHQFHCKLALYLNNIQSHQLEKLLSFVRLKKRVISIVMVLSEWDYEIDIEVENPQDVKAFIMNLTNEFSELIRDYTLFRIVAIHKFTFFPQEMSH